MSYSQSQRPLLSEVLLACPVSPVDDVNVFLGLLPRPQRVRTSGSFRDDGLSRPPLTLNSDVDLDLTLVAGELGPAQNLSGLLTHDNLRRHHWQTSPQNQKYGAEPRTHLLGPRPHGDY
ncbi:hypothetical protein D4764_19G0002020 [Takifugu flavidus]|uniref:Uncharacterized protein n=1 Tax=Takifugu flavidus TaxID=433684 RepID=A0A5C6NLY2_9TELE|nr:hypothetical protein D4764_19G0002020 [Takifugu flavidus]